MTQIIALIQAAVVFGTTITFGAMGEIVTEKSGNLNLGVPGIMYFGGIAGLIGVFFYERSTDDPSKLLCLIIALICAFAASALGGSSSQCITTQPQSGCASATRHISGGNPVTSLIISAPASKARAATWG